MFASVPPPPPPIHTYTHTLSISHAFITSLLFLPASSPFIPSPSPVLVPGAEPAAVRFSGVETGVRRGWELDYECKFQEFRDTVWPRVAEANPGLDLMHVWAQIRCFIKGSVSRFLSLFVWLVGWLVIFLVRFCAQIRCSIMGSVRRMYKSSAIARELRAHSQQSFQQSGTCS
jgi:hypothetical protein